MFRLLYFGVWIFLSCEENNSFPREEFENEWWEVQAYPICFNFHETGDLLLYEKAALTSSLLSLRSSGQYRWETGVGAAGGSARERVPAGALTLRGCGVHRPLDRGAGPDLSLLAPA